jgi:iron complex outermembrane receptor protein
MILRQILLATAATIAFGGSAWAQSAPAPAPAPDGRVPASTQATQLDEVVVTAQKRSQSINDVPAAVTAFTAETRQIIGLSNLSDFANFTPGLTYSKGDDRVFLRGIGRQTNTAGSDPGVATYTDGFYDSGTSGVSQSDFFVDRVEVLRGPQGTLYGRNSIGGAINAISKRPTDAFLAEARFTAADYDVLAAEAVVSGPLTDNIRARLSGSYSDQGEGYFKNVATGGSEGGNGESSYLELQVEADLASNLEAWVKVSSSSSDVASRGDNSPDPYDTAPFLRSSLTPSSGYGLTLPAHTQLGTQTTNPGVNDIRAINTNTVSRSKLDDDLAVVGQLLWSLPAFDVKFVGGYHEYVLNQISDADNTPVTGYDFPLAPFAVCGFVPGCTPFPVRPSTTFGYLEDRKFGSAEINLISNGDGPLQWIAGAYYYRENLRQQSHFTAPDQAQLAAPANGPANPDRDYVYAGTDLESESYAAFGQIDYALSDTLTLTGGLRYTHDQKSADEAIRVLCLGCVAGLTLDQLGSLVPAIDITTSAISTAAAPGVVSPVTIDPVTGRALRSLDDDWSAVSGTASLQWRPNDRTLGYASYSRGYKSGGFNAGGITAAPETDPEYVDAFEAGLKRRVTPDLQINAALYYYLYDGLQIPLAAPSPGGFNLTSFFNLDESKSYGLEVEANWQATSALNFLVTYALADSEITACCYIDVADPNATEPGAQPSGAPVAGQQAQSLNGQELPRIPRNKIGVNANYSIDFNAGSLVLSGTYTWRDATYHSVFNREYYQTPSFDQLDLRAIWTPSDDRYRVVAYVKNVFDADDFDTMVPDQTSRYVQPLASGRTVRRDGTLMPPRTVGIQLTVSFH